MIVVSIFDRITMIVIRSKMETQCKEALYCRAYASYAGSHQLQESNRSDKFVQVIGQATYKILFYCSRLECTKDTY